jgi:hypothetical protein
MTFRYVLRYDLDRIFFVLKRITPDPFIIMSSTSRALNYGWGSISRRAAYLPTSRGPGPAADRPNPEHSPVWPNNSHDVDDTLFPSLGFYEM